MRMLGNYSANVDGNISCQPSTPTSSGGGCWKQRTWNRCTNLQSMKFH